MPDWTIVALLNRLGRKTGKGNGWIETMSGNSVRRMPHEMVQITLSRLGENQI